MNLEAIPRELLRKSGIPCPFVFVFSFVPRSQGLWGWAKHTGAPRAADTSLCRANSFPLSVVRLRYSTPSSRRIRAAWTADAVLSYIFAANSKRALRSTTVTRPPLPGLPRTVSISQFPMSSLCLTSLGRSSMKTVSLICPRPSCLVFLLL